MVPTRPVPDPGPAASRCAADRERNLTVVGSAPQSSEVARELSGAT
ncbi:hypothetical protein ACFPM0_22850 [Pseudonocardia sulfidoxydans]